MAHFCRIHSVPKPGEGLSAWLAKALPDGPIRRIVIKPNWVRHQTDPDFPIQAMVTSTDLVQAVVEACERSYPLLESILVADIPIQSCDWSLLTSQAGIMKLIPADSGLRKERVTVRDLRMRRVHSSNGYLVADSESGDFGDQRGYCDVVLDQESLLDLVSHSRSKFRVSDYSPDETNSSHRLGYHRYRVSRSLLECDLFINMPKMKTHQKAGITGALKNVVGINGNKAFLVHYQAGPPGRGGDEFPPNVRWPVRVQANVHQWARRAPRFVFRTLQVGWRAFRRAYGIQVKGTKENLGRRFLISAGAWYGNDSIWRMIYDLNQVILRAAPEGGLLQREPQRRYLAVLDGITAGEGNGPLQPLAVPAGIVAVSDNPFLMDFAIARMMGFDYRKIPQLAHHREFGEGSWGDFDPDATEFEMDDRVCKGIEALPVLHRFLPPPGWIGHIEIAPGGADVVGRIAADG